MKAQIDSKTRFEERFGGESLWNKESKRVKMKVLVQTFTNRSVEFNKPDKWSKQGSPLYGISNPLGKSL